MFLDRLTWFAAGMLAGALLFVGIVNVRGWYLTPQNTPARVLRLGEDLRQTLCDLIEKPGDPVLLLRWTYLPGVPEGDVHIKSGDGPRAECVTVSGARIAWYGSTTDFEREKR